MSDSAVVNTTDEKFETDVMVRSQIGLVVVDFWADWCAPCRMLGPILEEVIEEFGDRVTLVKADTAVNEQAAAQFGVSGIPAVFAVRNAEIVDSFQGALPANDLRQWIEGCLSREKLLEIRSELDSNPAQAETQIRELLSTQNSSEATVMLVQALYQQGKNQETQELLSQLADRGFLEPECEKIQSELALQDSAVADLASLKKQAEDDPDNLSLQLEFAKGLAASRDFANACETCLRLVELDRSGTGEQARLLMLDVFRILGDEDEVTREYRRRLSMALY